MVLVFLTLLNLWSNLAFAGCDLNAAQLQELRTSLLCSCDNDTTACAILVDAFQRPSTNTLAAMVGAAIGTHINYRRASKYTPSGRLSQAGLNDWANLLLSSCPLVKNVELKKVLGKSINDQLQELNANKALCKEVENIYSEYEEPHFVARCDGKNVVAKPRQNEESVQHTLIREPASSGFTHYVRSLGGGGRVERPIKISINGRQSEVNSTLTFMKANSNEPEKPSLDQKKRVELMWTRYRREFVEMTNCCQFPDQTKKHCQKFKFRDD